jgi:signal transduction histidine kinase
MLSEFIELHRDEIIRRCRATVAMRSIPPPTITEIEHGVPLFLDQVVEALRNGLSSSPAISASALLHGHDLLRQGYTVSQVVHDYGDVCQSITQLAAEVDAPISVDDFRMLNGCLDDAIAGAVTQFGRERAVAANDASADREQERLGFFAHEMRNLIHTALIAFEVVKSGNVGVQGSTGTVLHRSLVAASDLIARSLAEVRLTQGVQRPEVFPVSALVEEVALAARLQSNAKGVHFTVLPIDDTLSVEADRRVLAAALTNVLQNAFKFTRPKTTVTIKVEASAERVCIEVTDECGGLPSGEVHEIFRPFEQRGGDRSGIGLGLAFCRWAVEANHGRIDARDRPGIGCVFTIDLPRAVASVLVRA